MEYDYVEALKRTKFSKRDVENLRVKIKELSHVPRRINDRKLLCFLSACATIDYAAEVISSYYTIRRSHPSVFSNLDPSSAQVQQCLENQYYFHMPNTPKGNSLIYHCLSNNKASNYIFDEACKTFFMTIDLLLCKQGPSAGLIIIFDMKNVGYRHLLQTSVGTLKAFFQYLQNALPARLEAIHVLNCTSLFDLVLAMIKPFLKSDIVQRMHLHPPGMDWKKFQSDFCIPNACLPSDFGGDLDSSTELHKAHCEMLVQHRDFFITEDEETKIV